MIERAAERIAEKQPLSLSPQRSRQGARTPGTSGSRRVAKVDLAQLRRLGMVTPDQDRSQIADEFRIIKRPLITAAFHDSDPERRLNLVMVTSSLPQEGKTFCAINLAISMAMEMDYTVLLVDADVVRPTIIKTLGVQAEAGLIDLIRDETLDPDDYIIQTDIDNLSILPAGNQHARATELLASRGMSSLMSRLATRSDNRIIICDSPPLLVTTEARELARRMGQVVVVVEAEKTTAQALSHALSYLAECNRVSLVYNKAGVSSSGNYSYYGT